MDFFNRSNNLWGKRESGKATLENSMVSAILPTLSCFFTKLIARANTVRLPNGLPSPNLSLITLKQMEK